MTHWLTIVSQVLTPRERFEAMKDWSSDTVPGIVLNVLLYSAASAALLAACILLVMHVRMRRKAQAGASFQEQAQRLGLNQAEQNLLACIARLAGLHAIEAIFTMEQAFVQGSGSMMKGQRVSSMPAEKQARVAGMINALCQKLGFQALGARAGSSVTSRQVIEGSVCSFTTAEGDEHVATIREVQDEVIVVELRAPADIAPETPVVVHYSNMGCVWEFDSKVCVQTRDSVHLMHCENIRFVNRRRFPRVPVRHQALLADLEFFAGDNGIAPLRFVPATLTEIAGPGLLFESILQTEVGRKAIAIVELAGGSVVQGVGRVRRVRMLGNSRVSVVVEPIDIKPQELSELARQTSAAGKIKNWRAESNEPAASGSARQ